MKHFTVSIAMKNPLWYILGISAAEGTIASDTTTPICGLLWAMGNGGN